MSEGSMFPYASFAQDAFPDVQGGKAEPPRICAKEGQTQPDAAMARFGTNT
jgi:hypothetical protein